MRTRLGLRNEKKYHQTSIPAQGLIFVLRLYHRWISPLLGPVCRFYPSCSVYAMDVLAHHGLFKGMWLSFKRLLKCQPFHPGGIDLPPIPQSKDRLL